MLPGDKANRRLAVEDTFRAMLLFSTTNERGKSYVANFKTPSAITLHIATRLSYFERNGWGRDQLQLLLGWQTQGALRKHLAEYLNERDRPEITGEFFGLKQEHVLICTDIPRLYTVRIQIGVLRPRFKLGAEG